eukprot:902483-Alexandrium_andersonii.AAC.1
MTASACVYWSPRSRAQWPLQSAAGRRNSGACSAHGPERGHRTVSCPPLRWPPLPSCASRRRTPCGSAT